MKHIPDFYKAVQAGISQVRGFIQLFVSQETTLDKPIRHMLINSSIMEKLVECTKGKEVFLDIVSPMEPEKIESHFKRDDYRVYAQELTDPDYVKSLTQLVKSFIIIDHQTAFIRTKIPLRSDFLITDKAELINLMDIFAQIVRNEMNKERQSFLPGYPPPYPEKPLYLGTLPESIQKSCIESSIVFNNHHIFNIKRRER